ncbi:hypothetical protein [Maritimibacter fusiformis]|uniref:hypothetical protein n=1 Tax=Maritimibacter fusiformis TaxID=2603819 RepID=UPI0011DCABE4|nr:hypothetical protein [Maritimibacter fusiformis]
MEYWLSKMIDVVPSNLKRLWAAEDELRTWATEVIASEPYLRDHLQLIEAYMDCVETARRAGPSGDRHVALMGLFLRTFDASSYCVRSAMSGNYTGCAMYARDLLETQFLLGYLMDEPGRPEEWLSTDPKNTPVKYRPIEIRKYLDNRDGFEMRRREQNYKALSTLGSHPSPGGFELKRDGSKAIRSGPFKQRNTLELCIQEAARVILPLCGLLREYCKAEVENGQKISSRLGLLLQRTREKYFTD